MSKPKNRKEINNYIIHLDHPLGEGSYAKVYLAHDETTQTNYAVKIV
jgi:serine/threonine protein kinase